MFLLCVYVWNIIYSKYIILWFWNLSKKKKNFAWKFILLKSVQKPMYDRKNEKIKTS